MSEELEKLRHKQYVAERKLTAAKHKEKRLQSELKRLTRSERTHQLCTRAGMLETFLKEPTALSDEDVMELTFIFQNEAVQKKLNLLIENQRETQEADEGKTPDGDKGAIIHHLRMVMAFCRKPIAWSLMIKSPLLHSSRESYTSPTLALPATPLWTCRRGTIASNHSPTSSEYPLPDRTEKYRSFLYHQKEVQSKMLVPHLEIRIVKRSKGSSAVAGAAYPDGFILALPREVPTGWKSTSVLEFQWDEVSVRALALSDDGWGAGASWKCSKDDRRNGRDLSE